MPWQPTLAGALSGEETPEEMTKRNAREIAQARLAWQTRSGNSLALAVKWRRFYQTREWWPGQLRVIEQQLEVRLSELRGMTEHPDRTISGDTWTRAMVKREDLEAELSVVRRFLKAGG